MAARETVGLGKQRAFVAEFEDLVEDDTGEVVRGPGAQGAEALREAATGCGVEGLPDATRGFVEQLAQMLAAIANTKSLSQ